MLNYDLRYDDGILVLSPEGPLEARDFTALARNVDAYLDGNRALRAIMIRARGFAGWKDFGALVAHLKFAGLHHRKIEKVAVVSDGDVSTALPQIANHFAHAKVKHFGPDHTGAALHWAIERGRAWMCSAP